MFPQHSQPTSENSNAAVPTLHLPESSNDSSTHNVDTSDSGIDPTEVIEDSGSNSNSNTATQPVASHPMITTSKLGIFKPKVYLSECTLPTGFLTEFEPKSAKLAMQDSKIVMIIISSSAKAKLVTKLVRDSNDVAVSAGAEKAMKNGRVVSVAGSPKFRMYETDFGWGRPKNCEVVHIGANGAFSFNESREEEGGVQIGVVVNREKLDLFQ
ncbi:hypothetical protein EZV62_020521 [Acer yangbiense]|uniref:Uncharacterized protein n=1 Tax=Acer yangbiense TaxID=1000413 RepID=A0A5C7HF44_9ROSI|nr:hypothetical protein EZV62_020521 [Acer yangbiense]